MSVIENIGRIFIHKSYTDGGKSSRMKDYLFIEENISIIYISR